MKKIKLIIFAIIIICFSCNNNDFKKNVKNINVGIKIERFDLSLKQIKNMPSPETISQLTSEFGEFFTIYNNKIINIGDAGNEYYLKYLNLFLNDYSIVQATKEVENVFSNIDIIEKELNLCFKYIKYYYPDYPIPRVLTFVAGFNQSIVLTDNFIGIGLDKYLGADCNLYEMLNTQKYLRFEMSPEFINVDIMKALAENDFPNDCEEKSLISEMIYNGKILYYINSMMPEIKEARLNKYSAEQMKYCKTFEKDFWTALVERKLLFSNNLFEIRKLTQNSPYSSFFGPECPPRFANWIGYQIVKSYVKNNNLSLIELMKEKDYLTILQQSVY